jgi:hypothetical protein
VIASFRRYEQNLTNLKSANEKLGNDDHWVATRILCFPSHIDASFLKEATSLSHAEIRIDTTAAFHQAVEYPHICMTASSGMQSSTEEEDDIGSLDYFIEDANWMWSEGLAGYSLSTSPRPAFENP